MRQSNFRIRWAAVATALVCLTGGVAVGMGVQFRIDHSIPPCTDSIADAGGICEGPLIDEHDGLPPCPTEDSDNCYWDADTMGNGQGRSFETVDGVTTYED